MRLTLRPATELMSAPLDQLYTALFGMWKGPQRSAAFLCKEWNWVGIHFRLDAHPLATMPRRARSACMNDLGSGDVG